MFRIATWNVQHLFPVASFEKKWQFLEEVINPDIAILTEAKFPQKKTPDGWMSQFREEGLGKGRPWGTILASRNVPLSEVTEAPSRLRRPTTIEHHWPGAVQIAEISRGDATWGVVVGMYALLETKNRERHGNGIESCDQIFDDLSNLIRSYRNVIVAGDLNVLPLDKSHRLKALGLVDVVEATSASRPPLDGCFHCGQGSRCGHLWTHRNKSDPDKPQNIDYMFVSKPVTKKIQRVYGGVQDFPDAWEYSDHAPVVMELDI